MLFLANKSLIWSLVFTSTLFLYCLFILNSSTLMSTHDAMAHHKIAKEYKKEILFNSVKLPLFPAQGHSSWSATAWKQPLYGFQNNEGTFWHPTAVHRGVKPATLSRKYGKNNENLQECRIFPAVFLVLTSQEAEDSSVFNQCPPRGKCEEVQAYLYVVKFDFIYSEGQKQTV